MAKGKLIRVLNFDSHLEMATNEACNGNAFNLSRTLFDE